MASRITHIFRSAFFSLLIALAVGMAAPAFAQDAPPVPLRVGVHDGYTRLVFDFPKLTAYYVSKTGSGIDIRFDTPMKISVPAEKSPVITGMTLSSGVDNNPVVSVALPEGVTFKHYRLLKKIIVDLQPSGAPATPAPKTAAKTAEKTPEKPAEEKPQETKKEEKPAPAVAATVPPPEKAPEKTAAPVVAPPVAAVPVAPVAVEPLQEQVTTITLATIEPLRLAVFQRFNTLWLVTNLETAGSIEPDVAGPDAGLLGNPKVLKFDGGSAWRYALPHSRHVSVEKKSLSWLVNISKTPQRSPANADLKIVYDETGRKAKLVAGLKTAGSVLSFEDPAVGDMLFVIPTELPGQRISDARLLADLEIIPAAIGMVARPLKDGVRINKIQDYAMITSPDGILATPDAGAGASLMSADASAEEGYDGSQSRLFDFPNWRQGGIKKLAENKRLIEDQIVGAETPEQKTRALMRLALLYFANNFGQETLGVLRLIEAEDKEIIKNKHFIAVRGAASAMAGQYAEALEDLGNPALRQNQEVDMWIGYAAAASEQWRMANKSFPKNNRLLTEYPDNIAVPFTIYMAESALRLGQTAPAKKLLESLNLMSGASDQHYEAALLYLKGEAARQDGDVEEALKLWGPVARGLDRLYHTKASFALTTLELQEKKITLKEAIDRVDSLRFAWRGDGLEVQILRNLGKLKIDDNRYLSGLEDMKAAIALSEGLSSDAADIRSDMARTVSSLFIGDKAQSISPLEAVSVYNEFSNLLPEGPESAAAALNFAGFLISMDLLDKAEAMIENLLQNGRVPEEKKAATGSRLAAVYLLDAKPKEALSALEKTATADMPPELAEERTLLKARAQSQLAHTDAAIGTLSALASKTALRLKADVLWKAQRWAETAAAVEPLLPDTTATPSDADAQLVVNAAVAYKLAGDKAGLQNIKSRYTQAMAKTGLSPVFGVVTRDGGKSTLADRESILKIAGEVDMFKSFLDNYKAQSGKGS